MPVVSAPPGNNAILQNIVNSVRSYPELQPIIGASGWTQEPALSMSNGVMQRFLAQTMDWKWNRKMAPGILTVPLQQDYVTSITDLGWLEKAWKIDINNNTVPKPIFGMEAVRDLDQTSFQSVPFQISWIPNSLAIMGTWQPNTLYPCSYGTANPQPSPIQQFVDVNGNYLYIDGSVLKLNASSPGVGSIPVTPPPVIIFFEVPDDPSQPGPYGTSGSTEPAAPANSPAGTTVQDGSVVWTVADRYGIAFRLLPMPAFSGIAWLFVPVYQEKPPILISLQNTIAPIPRELTYLFRQGFLAMAYEHAGSKLAAQSWAKFEEALVIALKSGDRERDNAVMYPSEGLMDSGFDFTSIGPAWPFGPVY